MRRAQPERERVRIDDRNIPDEARQDLLPDVRRRRGVVRTRGQEVTLEIQLRGDRRERGAVVKSHPATESERVRQAVGSGVPRFREARRERPLPREIDQRLEDRPHDPPAPLVVALGGVERVRRR